MQIPVIENLFGFIYRDGEVGVGCRGGFMDGCKVVFSSSTTTPYKAGHNFSLMLSNLHFLSKVAFILKFNRCFYEICEHNGDKNRQSTDCSSGLLCGRA